MKKTRVINKKNLSAMIIGIVAIAIAIVCVFLYVSKPKQADKSSQSYLNGVDVDKLHKKVEKNFEGTYLLKDYVVYGETLSLYKSEYGSTDADKMQGNNIVLRNVMTDSTTSFTFNGSVDSGIDLGALKEGIYELYTYNHFEKERIYFKDAFKAKTVTTMRRDEKVTTVSFMADKNALKEYGIQFKKNYAFIIVTNQEPKEDIYDVVIDPCGNAMNYFSNTVDVGASTSILDEASSSLKFAKKVKKELEKKGLKVKILRKENETPGYYGVDGRPARAYKTKAKLYLALGASLDENVYAPYMLTSPYTNSGLANTVSYFMEQNDLTLYEARTNTTQENGVLYDSYAESDDGKVLDYELYPQLRETGGRATYAGVYGDEFRNADYKDAYGMYGLYFSYASAMNSQSVTYFNENADAIAKILVKSIVRYFEI